MLPGTVMTRKLPTTRYCPRQLIVSDSGEAYVYSSRMARSSQILTDRELVTRESGTIFKEAPVRVALGYPAPYGVGVSSLGFQTIYRLINRQPGVSCERFFARPFHAKTNRISTLERTAPVGSSHAVAFSLSCEIEIATMVELLEQSGIEPMASMRGPDEPVIIAGGPLTLLDPRLVAPLADIVVAGDGEEAIEKICRAMVDSRGKEDLFSRLDPSIPGLWIPSASQTPPPAAAASIDRLPATAATWSPDAELKNLFLVEAGRGCARGCAFCLLSGRSKCSGKFRPVPPEQILAAIPEGPPGVGLVGAAVTDHPRIEEIVESIVEMGKRVSLSSIRADRLTPGLAASLVRGGAKTLTLAADGSSQRLRDSVRKGISQEHLLEASRVAADAGVRGLKLYSMVALPGEVDGDIEEFATMIGALDPRLRISVAVQAFVPKPGTPLAGEPMEELAVIRKRLELVRKLISPRAHIVPTSARWSWLDWKLAHGGADSALAAVEAHRGGADFNAWKQAVKNHIEKKR